MCKRLFGEGPTEPHSLSRLTNEYGCDLLENARTAKSLRWYVEGQELDALKRRLVKIDVVGLEHQPRTSPIPSSGGGGLGLFLRRP